MPEIDFLQRNIFSVVFIGLLTGILVSHYLSSSLSLLVLFLGFALILFSLSQKKSGTFSALFLFSFFLLSFSLGGFRYLSSIPKESNHLNTYLDKTVTIEGEVADFPERVGDSQSFSIISDNQKILVQADLYPEINYGDLVVLKGKISKPESFKTTSGRVFDYPHYLQKEGIIYILNFAEIESIKNRGQGNFIKHLLFRIKRQSIEKIALVFPEPHGSLLSGILLGEKGSDEMEEVFRRTGLSHIVVLSGYNIAIISILILFLVSSLSKTIRLTLAGVFIGLFTVMVSSGAATVRAAVMAISVLFAKYVNKKVSVWRVLFIAVFAMIVWNPLIIFYDLGFQLSFLATAGIVSLSDVLKKKLFFLTDRFGFREMTVVSLSAQIAVLPLLIYVAGEFSVVSLPANLFVLPAVAPAMFLGAVTVLIASLSQVVAFPFSFLALVPLSYITKTAEFFSSFKFATVPFIDLSAQLTLSIYIAAALYILFMHIKRTRTKMRILFTDISPRLPNPDV